MAELFPETKFIWLLRHARKVTESTTKRGWFDENYTFPDKYRGTNTEGWKEYRINGNKAGAVNQVKWKQMTVFEKNCWYWNFWNTKIETAFSKMGNERKFILKLEDLEIEKENIQKFLGVENIIPLEPIHKNKTKKIHKTKEEFWTKEKKDILELYCGNLNSKFYPQQ